MPVSILFSRNAQDGPPEDRSFLQHRQRYTSRVVDIGLQDIQIALPRKALSPADLGFNLTADYYSQVSGARTLYRASQQEDAAELCAQAAEKLFSKFPNLAREVEALFVVTLPTEPTVAPISARLQSRLNTPASTFCLDFTLSCVGFLQASSVLLDVMKARGFRKALLFNVETLSKIISTDDKALQLIMSDMATVCLFSDQPVMRFENFEFGVAGELAPILEARSGTMFMDGPKLYETVVRTVPSSFTAALKKFGLTKDAVDYFAFHQGSRRVLDKLTDELGLKPEKVLHGLGEVGNVGSCSLPHLLAGLLGKPSREDGAIFCSAFGSGFQWAHASLRLKWNGS